MARGMCSICRERGITLRNGAFSRFTCRNMFLKCSSPFGESGLRTWTSWRDARRRAFSLWLRTGRLPAGRDQERPKSSSTRGTMPTTGDSPLPERGGTSAGEGPAATVARMHERPSPMAASRTLRWVLLDEGPDPDPASTAAVRVATPVPDPRADRGEQAQGGRPARRSG